MSLLIIEHLERFLGTMEGLWSESADGSDLPVDIARFQDVPILGAYTLVTIGLSSCRYIRQELLCTSMASVPSNQVGSIMLSVLQRLLDTEVALRDGQVLGPEGPLVPSSRMEAFYCAQPVYFDDELSVMKTSDPPTTLVWLVPVSRSESEFLRARGREGFENLLEKEDPNLLDWFRDPIV